MMRIEITLHSDLPIVLPKGHNHILQAFVYRLFDPLLRSFLHDRGYAHEKRKFRLFTFSRLQGVFKQAQDTISFQPPVSLCISSPKNEILQSLAEGLFREETYVLGKNRVYVNSINVLPRPQWKEEIIVRMLSPVTVYSTLFKKDGGKKTYYYAPQEEEFSRLIAENLKKKYIAHKGDVPADFDFHISAHRVRPQDQKVILYAKDKQRPTVIKGWMGQYKLRAAAEILEFAYDTGIGSKNSQGFGCFLTGQI
ncbi:MAG: CRISPR-associated endoribonuclease Cas6 [Candidatus Omnitrophota bacterium]